MPLPNIEQYDDLDGESCLEILHTRFYDLLHTLPELQRRFALTRVIMRLEISLDIWGATPPKKIYQRKFELEGLNTPEGSVASETHHNLVADVDSRDNPPDLIREEHGLPVPRAIRGQSGVMETAHVELEDQAKYARPPQPTPAHLLPANQASPTAKKIGKRTYAAFVEQDYGSLVVGERTGGEGPVIGGEKISGSKTDVTVLGLPSADGDGVAPVQADFMVGENSPYAEAQARRGARSPEHSKEIVERAIQQGNKVDRVLADNAHRAPKPAGRK